MFAQGAFLQLAFKLIHGLPQGPLQEGKLRRQAPDHQGSGTLCCWSSS
jgi:hypothetical protein